MHTPDSSLGALVISRPGLAARALLFLVYAYQRLISPLWPAFFGANAGCRFYPTCSHYAVEALKVHGAFKGAWLAAWRVLRCTPLSKGGIDTVPLRHRAPSCVRACSMFPPQV